MSGSVTIILKKNEREILHLHFYNRLQINVDIPYQVSLFLKLNEKEKHSS
jgi:hypothetical protein